MKSPIKMLGIIFVTMLVIFLIIILGFNNNKKEDIVNLDSKNKTISTSDFTEFKNNASTNSAVPPPLPKDNFIKFDDKAIQNVENGNSNNVNSNVVEPATQNETNKTEQENQKNPFAEFEEQNINNSENKSTIKTKLEVTKPESMVEYVKQIQKEIKFRGYDHNFKYNDKEYRKGDIFLTWYEIEEITPNFIRFKDENYSYNLRFLDDERI